MAGSETASKRKKDCLFFITPVFERYELASICLRQKVDAIEQLEKAGISADCVVVGDDDNIRIAKSLGLSVVVRENDYLGAKFNDGHEYAAKHGATHVAPVGSDSWMDPAWIIGHLPHSQAVLVSKHYAMVHKTGMKRAQFHIPYVSYVVPVKLLEHCNYRPIMEKRPKGCDTNTFETIDAGIGGPCRKITSKTSHELDTVAFQSPTQITDYDRLYGRWGQSQTYDTFAGLADIYPPELVTEIEEYYGANNDLLSYDLLERAKPYIKKYGGGDSLLLEIDACLIKRDREASLAKETPTA